MFLEGEKRIYIKCKDYINFLYYNSNPDYLKLLLDDAGAAECYRKIENGTTSYQEYIFSYHDDMVIEEFRKVADDYLPHILENSGMLTKEVLIQTKVIKAAWDNDIELLLKMLKKNNGNFRIGTIQILVSMDNDHVITYLSKYVKVHFEELLTTAYKKGNSYLMRYITSYHGKELRKLYSSSQQIDTIEAINAYLPDIYITDYEQKELRGLYTIHQKHEIIDAINVYLPDIYVEINGSTSLDDLLKNNIRFKFKGNWGIDEWNEYFHIVPLDREPDNYTALYELARKAKDKGYLGLEWYFRDKAKHRLLSVMKK